tara:strand:+ start:293 stop:682 length:390 start_codon:yes stop_codon:yes gene_type:complete
MELLFILGRVIFGLFFLNSGINHFKDVKGLTGYTASKNVPFPKASVLFTGILLVLGSLGVIFGVYVTFSLWLLILFLVPTTILMHPFWKETDPQTRGSEKGAFMKNMALAGATIMMLSIPLPWVLTIMS